MLLAIPEEFVEAQRRTAGEEDPAGAVQQAGRSEVAHRPLDRVALSERALATTELPCQLLERDRGGVEEEKLLQDGGLDGPIFLGGLADVPPPFHGLPAQGRRQPFSSPRARPFPGGSSVVSSAESAQGAFTAAL